MRFMNKPIDRSLAIVAILLSTAFSTGCTSIQKKYEVSGQSISVERKSTNRAYVDQLDVKDVNGQVSISGQVIWHTSVRGPLEGNFYIDLVGSDGKIVKTVERSFSRSVINKRQAAFSHDLGVLPASVTKLVISYGD